MVFQDLGFIKYVVQEKEEVCVIFYDFVNIEWEGLVVVLLIVDLKIIIKGFDFML